MTACSKPGRIRVIRIGLSVRIHRVDVEDFAERLRSETTGPDAA